MKESWACGTILDIYHVNTDSQLGVIFLSDEVLFFPYQKTVASLACLFGLTKEQDIKEVIGRKIKYIKRYGMLEIIAFPEKKLDSV